MAQAKRDENAVTTLLGVTDDGNETPTNLLIDPATGRLKVSATISIDLDDINDVSITSATAGDILYYDGSDWVNLGIGTANQVLAVNSGATAPEWADAGGDVTGPGSSTDNAIARFDGTGGKTLQNSGITIDDSDNLSGVNNVTGSDTNFVTGTAGTNGDLVTWNVDGDAVDGPTPPTGTIVGTTDTQTLTNKTIDADNNTISNLAHGAEVDNPSSGVHGVTGSVVGTTDTQTLTNKTIDGDSNTLSNLDIGNEVDWAAATDVADRSATPASGDKLLLFEDGVGLRKIDWDDLPSGGSGTVDTSGTPVATDYARFTDADTIEGRSPAEVRADLSLEVGTDVLAFDQELQDFADSNITVTSDALAGISTLNMAGNLTNREAVNDGNPIHAIGSAADNELRIQAVYDSGAQTLSHVLFRTFTTNATADKGEFRFNVDGTKVGTFDDGGLEIKSSGSLSFGSVDILTDSAGTTTLNNIDALDATTESTIESAIDTLSNLTSVGTITTGTWSADLAADTVDAITEIASALKSGSDATLITGTAGTDQNLIEWDSNGDAIDSGLATADVVTGSSTDTFTNKTFDANGTGNSLSNVEVADLASSAKAGGGSVIATEFSKSITIEDPTASEDISMFFTNDAITITEMRAVLVGSSTPSVTWTIRHGTDRSATGAEVVTSGTTTTSTTTGSDVTSFNDSTVVADSFVWLETTAQSGTVDELHITVFYTID